MHRRSKLKEDIVLVGVVKSKRDLEMVLHEYKYRIPVKYSPVKDFDYIAFYEPKANGLAGKQIRYYSKVKSIEFVSRKRILPSEQGHPRARDIYLLCHLGQVKKLKKPIKNTAPRRVSFAFTTLKTLLKAKNLLDVYGVAPIEEIIGRRLLTENILALKEHTVSLKGKRFRLDFAVFCKHGKLAIECDNLASHRSITQHQSDKRKDSALHNDVWTVLRLKEKEILNNLDRCVFRIKKLINRLGGI